MSIKKNITLFSLIFFMSTFSFAGIMNEIRENQNQGNNSEQTQINETEKTQSDNVDKKENNNYDPQNYEEKLPNNETSQSYTGLYVFFIYLLLNFIIYIFVPKLRWLSIATPYEFAAKIKRNEAQEKTKHEKFKRLNKALIGFSFVYLIISMILSSFAGNAGSDGTVSSMSFFLTAFISHILYLFLKKSEKCSNCKSEDSMKEIRSKKHSLGRFTKPEKREVWTGKYRELGQREGSLREKIYAETYVDVSYEKIQRDFTMKCVICNEEFNHTEEYDQKL